jgi:hypothetical protein
VGVSWVGEIISHLETHFTRTFTLLTNIVLASNSIAMDYMISAAF